MYALSAVQAAMQIREIRNDSVRFANWVHQIIPYLRSQAFRVLKYHHLPNDLLGEIVNETVLGIQAGDDQPQASPSGWLYAQVRRAGKAVASDYDRLNHGDQRNYRESISIDRQDFPVIDRGDLVLEVKDLLNALPPAEADLLVKYLMEGMTQKELASMLNVSRATIGRLIASAMASARRAGSMAA